MRSTRATTKSTRLWFRWDLLASKETAGYKEDIYGYATNVLLTVKNSDVGSTRMSSNRYECP